MNPFSQTSSSKKTKKEASSSKLGGFLRGSSSFFLRSNTNASSPSNKSVASSSAASSHIRSSSSSGSSSKNTEANTTTTTITKKKRAASPKTTSRTNEQRQGREPTPRTVDSPESITGGMNNTAKTVRRGRSRAKSADMRASKQSPNNHLMNGSRHHNKKGSSDAAGGGGGGGDAADVRRRPARSKSLSKRRIDQFMEEMRARERGVRSVSVEKKDLLTKSHSERDVGKQEQQKRSTSQDRRPTRALSQDKIKTVTANSSLGETINLFQGRETQPPRQLSLGDLRMRSQQVVRSNSSNSRERILHRQKASSQKDRIQQYHESSPASRAHHKKSARQSFGNDDSSSSSSSSEEDSDNYDDASFTLSIRANNKSTDNHSETSHHTAAIATPERSSSVRRPLFAKLTSRKKQSASSSSPSLNSMSAPNSASDYDDGDDPEAWFHTIGQRDWTAVEQLVRSYDYKKYRPAADDFADNSPSNSRSSKPQKKLRVLKYLPTSSRSKSFNDDENDVQDVDSDSDDDEESIVCSPLLQTDSDGRTALHLGCKVLMPWKLLQSIFFLERSAAAIVDNDRRLPLHHALISNHHTKILDRLIHANSPVDLVRPDSLSRTPLGYAILRAEHKRDKSIVEEATWRSPSKKEELDWQTQQIEHWANARFLLDALVARKKLLSKVHEKTLLLEAVEAFAPPAVVTAMLSVSARILQRDQEMAERLLELLVQREYSISIIQKTLKICSETMPQSALESCIGRVMMGGQSTASGDAGHDEAAQGKACAAGKSSDDTFA